MWRLFCSWVCFAPFLQLSLFRAFSAAESVSRLFLQESLGGNCRTSLLVCVSPLAVDLGETKGSLQFGGRAMRVLCKALPNSVLGDAIEIRTPSLPARRFPNPNPNPNPTQSSVRPKRVERPALRSRVKLCKALPNSVLCEAKEIRTLTLTLTPALLQGPAQRSPEAEESRPPSPPI